MNLSILKGFFKGMIFGGVLFVFFFGIRYVHSEKHLLASLIMVTTGLLIGVWGWFITDFIIRKRKQLNK